MGVSSNGGSPKNHRFQYQVWSKKWTNDLDEKWGYPHFRKSPHIKISMEELICFWLMWVWWTSINPPMFQSISVWWFRWTPMNPYKSHWFWWKGARVLTPYPMHGWKGLITGIGWAQLKHGLSWSQFYVMLMLTLRSLQFKTTRCFYMIAFSIPQNVVILRTQTIRTYIWIYSIH